MTRNNVHTYDYPGADLSTDIATSLVSFAASVPSRIFQVLTTWQKRYEERLNLESMSDHLIRDMGMTRGDVRRELSKPFWDV